MEGSKKRYYVEFKSDYQIRFEDKDTKENFIISIVEGNKSELFLNELKIVTKE